MSSPGIVAKMRAMPDAHWREMDFPSALRWTKEGLPSVAFVIPGSSRTHPVWENWSLKSSRENFPHGSSPISPSLMALRSRHELEA